MNESKMERLDTAAEPLVEEIICLTRDIERKLPKMGYTMYKRSPIRSLQFVVKRMREAAAALGGID